jgi:hypothetical protein
VVGFTEKLGEDHRFTFGESFSQPDGRQEFRPVTEQFFQAAQLQVKNFVTASDKVNRNQPCFHLVTSMSGSDLVLKSVIKYNKSADRVAS